jgi:hypothetical protein
MRIVAVGFALAGCAASLPPVPPERIGRSDAMPFGYEAVENLVASCRSLERSRDLNAEPLENFDCRRARLERVLAELASDAGAEMLVRTRCGRDGRVLRCTATAARADSRRARAEARRELREFDPGPAPGPLAVEHWDEPRAGAAEDIEIDAELSGRYAPRAARRASDVHEPAAVPVSHREVGTLTARCEAEECSSRELRQALRIAAGALGVSDLVAVRCFERQALRECVASAALSEIDE